MLGGSTPSTAGSRCSSSSSRRVSIFDEAKPSEGLFGTVACVEEQLQVELATRGVSQHVEEQCFEGSLHAVAIACGVALLEPQRQAVICLVIEKQRRARRRTGGGAAASPSAGASGGGCGKRSSRPRSFAAEVRFATS